MGENLHQLREGVRKAYSAAAERPEDQHPFPVGRRFAESLGYPRRVLAAVPSTSVEAFSGVSNVSVFADIPAGARVLDLGCGAGLDSMLAARKVGPRGTVVGLDFGGAMLDRARRAKVLAALDNLDFLQGAAENLPLEDGTIDVIIANGIFNLNPFRGKIFGELARVVRYGGAVYAAELILRGPLPEEVRQSETDWFA